MKKSKTFYGWWVVLGSAILLAMLGPAPVALANIFQTPITAEFNITNSQFAISNSLVLGVGIFLSPVISRQLTSGNFKRNYLINLLIYTVAYIAYGFSTNIYIYYILSLFVGYGFLSTTIMPVSILINNWFVYKRGLALSLAMTGLGVGGVIFSPFVTYIMNTFGWRVAYISYGALMLIVAAPIMWFLIKVKPKDIGEKPLGNQITPNEFTSEKELEKTQSVDEPFSETRTRPYFLLLIAGTVLVGLVNNGGLAQFPPYLTELHGAGIAATIISVYSASGIVGKLLIGNINDRFGVVKTTLYACTMLVITYFTMLFAENIIAVFIMGGFFGLGNAIGSVMPPLITSAIFSNEQYSEAYGYVNSAMTLGMTFASLFTAGIADFTGSYNYAWIVLMLLAVVVAILWTSAYKNSQKYS